MIRWLVLRSIRIELRGLLSLRARLSSIPREIRQWNTSAQRSRQIEPNGHRQSSKDRTENQRNGRSVAR